MDKQVPPVKVLDEIRVKVENLGEKGHGVAKVDKFIIFVERGKVGEECLVKVSKVFEKFAFAKKIEN